MSNLQTGSDDLLTQISQCQYCRASLPFPAKPILQLNRTALIRIIGQAPGIHAHNNGIPFSDASGRRLRKWLNVSEREFYDPNLFAITPMAFCYPGKKANNQGDIGPFKACHKLWGSKVDAVLSDAKLTLVMGRYAADAYAKNVPLEEQINAAIDSNTIVLPHPSPRNNLWLKQHPWFEISMLPTLQQRVRSILKSNLDET